MNRPVTTLPGVGPKRTETLAKLGIETIDDLLRHYPFRYEDRRSPVPVGALKEGEAALVRVSIRRVIRAPVAARGSRSIPMKVICGDESGDMTLLYFNARWMSGVFHEGREYWVYGTPKRDFTGVSMAHPEIEAIPETGKDEEKDVPSGVGIVPVYPLTAGVSQKYLRGLVRAAAPYVPGTPEILPESIALERKLAPVSYALTNIHFPVDGHALNAARYRLIYEEMFLFQARLLFARKSNDAEFEHSGEEHSGEEHSGAGSEHSGDGSNCVRKRTQLEPSPLCSSPQCSVDDAAKLFPFTLTGAQRRAIEEIRSDMAGKPVMNRLLQGDVGSGKTAVAAAAAFFAAKSGLQTAIMAPTEILAAQHYEEFSRLFQNSDIRVCPMTSGLTPAQKRETKAGLESGDIHIAIGTHALIEPDVVFQKLGLVVTDEQHRFGVRQRLRLREKGKSPDALVMTATPIPRTLALMFYADLDVSVLDEAPPGRQPVTTRYIDSSKRDDAYNFAERVMAGGGQVYVVAPSIGDGDDDDEEAGIPMASALELVKEMTERYPHRRVSVLHGRMKGDQKEEIMRSFTAGETNMLVSTVVIEVGVDVPNATMMIIENAERFGLAGLHQLRGRIGRGAAKSFCVLISDADSELAVKRCETLVKETDGFRIAELDLELRGPGDFFGVRQHGLMEFKLADPAKHADILKDANRDAQTLLGLDPGLSMPEHSLLRRVIEEVIID